MRLSSAIDEYMLHGQAKGLSEHTVRRITYTSKLLLSVVGDRLVQDIKPRDIEEFVIYLREHVSPRTGKPMKLSSVGVHLSWTRSLFKLLVRRGHINRSPAIDVKVKQPKSSGPTGKPIPLDVLTQTIHYLLARKNYRVLMMFAALADSALRREEVALLQVSNIDTQRRVMFVERPKVGREQYLPISETFIWTFELWMTKRPKVDHDYLFTMPRKGSQPITPDDLGQTIRYHTGKVCGKEYGPHSIRHAWLTEAINRLQASPATVQNIAGHSSIDMTFYYVDVDHEAERAAIDQQPLLSGVVLDDVTIAAPEGYIVEIDD